MYVWRRKSRLDLKMTQGWCNTYSTVQYSIVQAPRNVHQGSKVTLKKILEKRYVSNEIKISLLCYCLSHFENTEINQQEDGPSNGYENRRHLLPTHIIQANRVNNFTLIILG